MPVFSTPSDGSNKSLSPPVDQVSKSKPSSSSNNVSRFLTYGKRTQARFIVKPSLKEWNVSPIESSNRESSTPSTINSNPEDEIDTKSIKSTSISPFITFSKSKDEKKHDEECNKSIKIRPSTAINFQRKGSQDSVNRKVLSCSNENDLPSPSPHPRKVISTDPNERKPLNSVSLNVVNRQSQHLNSPNFFKFPTPISPLVTKQTTTFAEKNLSKSSTPSDLCKLRVKKKELPLADSKSPRCVSKRTQNHETSEDSPVKSIRRRLRRISLSSSEVSESNDVSQLKNVRKEVALSSIDPSPQRLSISSSSIDSPTNSFSVQRDDAKLCLGESINAGPGLLPPTLPIFITRQTPLEELLDMCGQSDPVTFETFLSKVVLHSAKKLGEATFSEVYSIPHPLVPNESAAVKILPFDGTRPVNGCMQQTAHAVLQEFKITRIMGDLQTESNAGFIHVVRLGIIRDEYPQLLLDEWDRWDRENESESDRPDYLPSDQMYAILVLENAGIDLEHSKLKTWRQAKSLLGQAVASFSIAEREVEFEHRDLHWGNFMLKPTKDFSITYRSGSEIVNIKTSDLRATIIDYTLSRLHCRGRQMTCFLALEDEDYFNGEGDYQFDCYRIMRQETNRDWAGYYPKTNIIWLHYLALKILTKLPKTRSVGRKEFLDFIERILCYGTCDEMMRKDGYFKDVLSIKEKK